MQFELWNYKNKKKSIFFNPRFICIVQYLKRTISAEDNICRVKYLQSLISAELYIDSNQYLQSPLHTPSHSMCNTTWVQSLQSNNLHLMRLEWQCFPSGQRKSGSYHSRSCRSRWSNSSYCCWRGGLTFSKLIPKWEIIKKTGNNVKINIETLYKVLRWKTIVWNWQFPEHFKYYWGRIKLYIYAYSKKKYVKFLV